MQQAVILYSVIRSLHKSWSWCSKMGGRIARHGFRWSGDGVNKRISGIFPQAFIFLACCLLSFDALSANVSYSNATVNLIEVRSDAWGAWLIITLKDSAGNNITKLCDTAQNQYAIAISLLDSAAKSVEAVALMAKASGKTVAGWGIDTAAQTAWCGIGNFALQPN